MKWESSSQFITCNKIAFFEMKLVPEVDGVTGEIANLRTIIQEWVPFSFFF